jgi:spore coat polysaccharide biosynthesis predicted glycosyltransferase SpsG
MRTLLLANSLKKDFNITYVTQNLKGNQNHLIEQNGFTHRIVQNMNCDALLEVIKELRPALCIIDHYGMNIGCETQIKSICPLLVFDDEFKIHNADIVLNHSFIAKKSDYDYLKNTKILAGSSYTLLKDDFLSHKNRFTPLGSLKNKKILITLGGSDPLGLSLPIKKTLLRLEKSLHPKGTSHVHIVTTSANPKLSILKLADKELIVNEKNMAKLMQKYDLIITSASTSLLETFALKKPFIAIQCASNQSKTVDLLQEQNLKNVISKFSLASLKSALNFVQYHPHKIKRALEKYHFQKDRVAKEIINEYT